MQLFQTHTETSLEYFWAYSSTLRRSSAKGSIITSVYYLNFDSAEAQIGIVFSEVWL